MFNLLIIGANGGIGRQTVDQALAAGHRVTALVRNPANLPLTHPNLNIVKADVTSPPGLSGLFAGHDAIISAIGVSGGFNDHPTMLYSQGALHILHEMKREGLKRVFFISASAVETNPLLPFPVRLVSKYIIQKLLANMYTDLRRMERVVKETDLDWTIVRPPRLTDSKLTGRYRMAVNRFLKNGFKISRADTAHFMLSHIQSADTFRSVVEIGY
ncbi:MAG: SDR family oxidoreductase [Bacteroidota bacterium]|nr:SDR family oxidoreductase [Bacteroidota bacterium]